jgi:enamine deaminase RidA (YjgF/YER057c/UK114 family)
LKTEILKTHCDAETATLTLPSHAEHCITVQASETREMCASLRQTASNFDATILSQFVFAGSHHYEEFTTGMGLTDWPVVWLQGDACEDGDLYSMQAVAISGLNPQPIHMNGRDMGFTYEDETASYCRLRGVIPQDLTASRMEQTRSAFETMDAALKLNGFKFTDTIRTWIYLDQLLEWYDDFNIVRTEYFNETGIFDHMVPASTGIGASNQYGAAMMMDVLAVKPKDDRLKIQDVISPLQNPALDYKSSFARAVEMAYPTHKNLLISGTASIDPEGHTAHLDDPEKQIRLTLDVIKEILRSRDMGWDDLFRGIAYFKDMAYQPLYEKIAVELGIPRFPLAISHADVCRHDLLFEIEVDAVKVV